jgi:RNA polymerase sigma-70 factor (ECF subfamily)
VDAEDLVQETILRALDSASRLLHQSVTHLRRWLSIVMKNLSFDRHRARRREVLVGRLDEIAPNASSEPALAWRFVSEDAVEAAVRELPDHMQKVYSLFIRGLPYSTIATQLDIPIGTVGGRIHRARAYLLRILAARDPRLHRERIGRPRCHRSPRDRDANGVEPPGTLASAVR